MNTSTIICLPTCTTVKGPITPGLINNFLRKCDDYIIMYTVTWKGYNLLSPLHPIALPKFNYGVMPGSNHCLYKKRWPFRPEKTSAVGKLFHVKNGLSNMLLKMALLYWILDKARSPLFLSFRWISGMLYIFDILSYLSCLVRSLLCEMSLLLTVLPMCGPIKAGASPSFARGKGAFQGDSLFLLAFNPIIQSKPYSWYLSPLVWCSHLSLFATNLVGILSHECRPVRFYHVHVDKFTQWLLWLLAVSVALSSGSRRWVAGDSQ